MPAPPDLLEAVVAAESDAHDAALDELTAQVATSWIVLGGTDDTSKARWIAAVIPILAAARLVFARRGAAWSRLMWALQTDGTLDLGPGDTLDLDQNDEWRALAARAEKHAASPVTYARWLLAGTTPDREPTTPAYLRARDTAIANARAYGGGQPGSLLATVVADPTPGRYTAALELAGLRATRLAIGDANRAHAIGIEAGVPPAGTVKRYLKVPRPTACGWCFTVATRGYRNPGTVPRHDHDKCLVLPLFTKATAGVPGRGDWQQRLRAAGYGPLLDNYGADAATRARVAQQVIDTVPGLADLFATASQQAVTV